MRKIIKCSLFILVLLHALLVSTPAFAAKVKSNNWNPALTRKYKNVTFGLYTGKDTINIFVGTSKKENVTFDLSAGTNSYKIRPNLEEVSFKKRNLNKINVTVKKYSSQGTTSQVLTKSATYYRRYEKSSKKKSYLLEISLPIKKLDEDLDQSTIINLVTHISNHSYRITTLGLSSNPKIIVGISLLILLWIYLMSVFKRAKVYGVYYWISSIGFFVIIAGFFHNHLASLLSHFISWIMLQIGNITNLYTSNLDLNLLFLPVKQGLIQITINPECSGMLELLVFESLLIFYPIYNWKEKVLRSIEGFSWITLSNILRILLVIIVAKYAGSDSIFWVHSIISRILFYVLVVILYYNVFTKQQIIKGWKG